jgi:hypothetical protein
VASSTGSAPVSHLDLLRHPWAYSIIATLIFPEKSAVRPIPHPMRGADKSNEPRKAVEKRVLA